MYSKQLKGSCQNRYLFWFEPYFFGNEGSLINCVVFGQTEVCPTFQIKMNGLN